MAHWCVKCHSLDNLINYNKGLPRKDGTRKQYYICNPCNNARAVRYRDTVRGKRTQNKINQKRRKKYTIRFNPPFIQSVEIPSAIEREKESPIFYTYKAQAVSEQEWRRKSKESQERILKKYS